MEPKYCIDIFGKCPKKFRNRRYEHSLAIRLDEQYRKMRDCCESKGLPAGWLKRFRKQRQYGARINQNLKLNKGYDNAIYDNAIYYNSSDVFW